MLWRGGGGYKRRQGGGKKRKEHAGACSFAAGWAASLTPPIPANKNRPAKQDGFWWGMVDSNHRRHCQQIYSLSPLATREIPQIYGYSIGAGGRIRTPDLLITNQLLYQLSYTSISPANRIIPELSLNVNKKVYQETENLSL